MSFRTLLWWWGPVVVWCGLIFWLSSTPNLQISSGFSDFLLRKTAHMVVYGILFLMVYRALLRDALAVWRQKIVVGAAVLTVAYALSDEFHQTLVPTRNGNWGDIGIDVVGIAIAVVGLGWWGWWNRVLTEAKPEVTSDQ